MANDEGKRKLTAPLAVLNKYKYVLLVAAIGAALLLWPGTKTESSPAESGPSGGEIGRASGRERVYHDG